MNDDFTLVFVDTQSMYKACQKEGVARLDYKKLLQMFSKRSGLLTSFWAGVYKGSMLKSESFEKFLKRLGFKIMHGFLDNQEEGVVITDAFYKDMDKCGKFVMIGNSDEFVKLAEEAKKRNKNLEIWFTGFSGSNDYLKLADTSLMVDVTKLAFEEKEKEETDPSVAPAS